MEDTKLKQGLAAGSAKGLSVEIVQSIMRQLSWDSIKKVAEISPSFLSILEGAGKTIFYRACLKEISREFFEYGIVRYASTIPALRESLNVIIGPSTRPLDAMVQLVEKRTFNPSKFDLPAEYCTMAAFRNIMEFHENVAKRVWAYEVFVQSFYTAFDGQAEMLANRTREEMMRIPLAVYAMETARLLFPDEFKRCARVLFRVRFRVDLEGEREHWANVVYAPCVEPPFLVTKQSLTHSWDPFAYSP
ncbi:hypothetical protein Daesc_002089 [Daldinia eschscholtzii]|uniref:F-box domain-containing protein n=1 Tax=Daldinia eschscholtzii TaxID=292717 RepID=A0AAX6MW16_9PEZI